MTGQPALDTRASPTATPTGARRGFSTHARSSCPTRRSGTMTPWPSSRTRRRPRCGIAWSPTPTLTGINCRTLHIRHRSAFAHVDGELTDCSVVPLFRRATATPHTACSSRSTSPARTATRVQSCPAAAPPVLPGRPGTAPRTLYLTKPPTRRTSGRDHQCGRGHPGWHSCTHERSRQPDQQVGAACCA